MKFCTRVRRCSLESKAHSIVKVAPMLVACAASRFQPLHIWSCSFQCDKILDCVAGPRFQLGPPIILKPQPAVHCEEYHKWQFEPLTQAMTVSTVER